jgi:hypothetical protein
MAVDEDTLRANKEVVLRFNRGDRAGKRRLAAGAGVLDEQR